MDPVCSSIKDVLFTEHFKFSLTYFNNRHGFSLSVHPGMTQGSLNGFYFCQLKNAEGSLNSNIIEILDINFYRKRKFL